MSEQQGSEPALGERTPTLQEPPKQTWYATRTFVAVVALLVGAALGGVVTAVVGDDDADEVLPTLDRTTTTTTAPRPTLPEVCIDTLEAAQQGLELVNQALGNLRQGDFGQLDRVLGELDRLRARFADRVTECRERLEP